MTPIVNTQIDQVEVKYVNGAINQVFVQYVSTITDSSNNGALIAQTFSRQTYQAADPLVAAIVAATATAAAAIPVQQ